MNITCQIDREIDFEFGVTTNIISSISYTNIFTRYSKFTSLKNQYPNLKTYLSVGGWNFGAAPFTWMASSSSNRTAFIKSTIPFLRKYKFDGLDVDWEYPSDADRHGVPEDKEHFVMLLKVSILKFL